MKKYSLFVFLESFFAYIVYLYVVSTISNRFRRPYINNGLGLLDNALMWIFLFLCFLVPILTAGIPGVKLKTRAIGFIGLIGSLAGAFVVWLFLDKNFGLFGLFAVGLTTLVSFNGIIAPEKKIPNYLYFMALGLWSGMVNAWFIHHFRDVYTYTMFVILHLLPVIICGMKKLNWAWSYIYGWDIGAVISMMVFDALIGGYLLVVPHFLVWAVLIYVNKIWRAKVKIEK